MQIKTEERKTARDFYNLLLNYQSEKEKSGYEYYGLEGGICTIHKIFNKNFWYNIYKDGTVIQEFKNTDRTVKMSINDLTGDNYELYSPFQVVRCGYIELNIDTSKHDIQNIMYRIFNEKITEDRRLDWSVHRNYFRYGSKKSAYITMELSTIRKVVGDNINRRYYGLSCFPFNKCQDRTKSIYVKFIVDTTEVRTKDEQMLECDKALSELLSYFTDIDKKWINVRIPKQISD